MLFYVLLLYVLLFWCFLFQGDMIAAMVRKEDLCLWEEKVVEGQTYIMHNFKILKNQGQFRVCEHPYKLLFIGATTIKQQPISSIPLNVYNFKSIEDIVDGNYSADLVYGMYIWCCCLEFSISILWVEWVVILCFRYYWSGW